MHRFFCLNKQPINYSREMMGGLINFLAIAYIIAVNPMIVNAGGHGFPLNASITATIVTIIIMTTLAGFIIKLPFVVAPGMGMNAMVSYTLVLHDKLPIPVALGVIFWSSVILFILSVTPLRQKIINAIPYNLQIALSVGIGLFLILVGFKNAGIIISNPNTIIGMHPFDNDMGLCFTGFIIATILFIKKKPYALALPILIVTVLSFLIGGNAIPAHIIDKPDFSLFMQIDFIGCIKLSIIPAILSLFLVNFFDATSSVVGLLSQIDYKNRTEKDSYYKRALAVDGLAGMMGKRSVSRTSGVPIIRS